MKKTYSTRTAARLAGISLVTLNRWMAAGKVRASITVPMDGRTLHRWTTADVERVRKYKVKFYMKGRGLKKATAKK